MPLIETKGAASAQGFGEFAKVGAANYIEDVFSTYLYTGNGSTQTITNGIDLSTKGGLVWIKQRGSATGHRLTDTARGAEKSLATNNTAAQNDPDTGGLTSFSSTGFSLGSNSNYNNTSGTYVSWTFREQPKFFDVVTYTGDGANRTIAHNLGSVPGCIIVKRTDTTGAWQVYHRSLANTEYLVLNTTAAKATGTGRWNSTTPTATEFSLGTEATVNANGGTYVAYLFAHDAGGFGLTGTDNVITCGSYTTDSSGVGTVNLGWEPQWILVKAASAASSWFLVDNMRGFTSSYGAQNRQLYAELAIAEEMSNFQVNATGFKDETGVVANSQTVIYIAIRRGPMKTPTTGTSVFAPVARAGTSATATVTAGFPVDMTIIQDRTQNSYATPFDRLRGATNRLFTALTLAEASEPTSLTSFAVQTGFTLGTDVGFGAVNTSGDNYINWNFRRAPGFFDIACYSGNGTAGTAINHNLGVVPELVIVKKRSDTSPWNTLYQPSMRVLMLNASNEFKAASLTKFYFGNDSANVSPTASTFTVASDAEVNQSGATFVAYLFATVAGVSKVGSYTGTGNTLQIDCGFTGGARFVLIKRTDVSGSWYVWDSARGIVSGNDPYLLLNSTAAEVTNTDWVDTHSPGFELSNAAGNNVNINGGSFIFLAIA